ncbi:MAG TPA: hypothetical protein VI488_19720 [Candidatus Angelobacter sp.]
MNGKRKNRREVENAAAPDDSKLGKTARVFDNAEIIHLLRAAIKREGNQTAFARRYGLERTHLNAVMNGKRPASSSIAKALGLRQMYGRDEDGER